MSELARVNNFFVEHIRLTFAKSNSNYKIDMDKKKDKSLKQLIIDNNIKKSALKKIVRGLNTDDKQNKNYKLK